MGRDDKSDIGPLTPSELEAGIEYVRMCAPEALAIYPVPPVSPSLK